jgi:hypothetical protein
MQALADGEACWSCKLGGGTRLCVKDETFIPLEKQGTLEVSATVLAIDTGQT